MVDGERSVAGLCQGLELVTRTHDVMSPGPERIQHDSPQGISRSIGDMCVLKQYHAGK